MTKLAYSIKEASDLTPWGKSQLYEMIASGELPSRVQHRRRYIMHDDLMALLLKVEPDTPGNESAAHAA